MSNFDARMRAQAQSEGCPLPEGFDARLSARLEALPAPGAAHRPQRLRRSLLAAAVVCVALWVSALALSPTLRDALAEILGEFAPFTQRVEGVSCVENGIEIKVISAMGDSAMVKVYAEARDLTGDRLHANMDLFGGVERERPEDARHGTTTVGGACVGFDEESGTALLEFSVWGSPKISEDALRLKVLYLCPDGLEEDTMIGVRAGGEPWDMALTVEKMEERTFAISGAVAGKRGEVLLRQLSISPLGVTLTSDGKEMLPKDALAVLLRDGTTLHPRFGGSGTLSGETQDSMLSCWEFASPVELEQVIGVAIGLWYLPVEGDTAGAGRWLTELPK